MFTDHHWYVPSCMHAYIAIGICVDIGPWSIISLTCTFVQHAPCIYSGIDPEINQGGCLGYRLGFRSDLSYIVSITIAAKFKVMKWGVWQTVGLACLVCESMLFPDLKIALLRLNLEVVLTENYKTVAKCCGSAGHLQ